MLAKGEFFDPVPYTGSDFLYKDNCFDLFNERTAVFSGLIGAYKLNQRRLRISALEYKKNSLFMTNMVSRSTGHVTVTCTS